MLDIELKNVYIKSSACCVGPLEGEGPLHDHFDYIFETVDGGYDSFEKSERAYINKAIDLALRKSNQVIQDMDCIIGGDLMNQLSSSHFVARDTNRPFIGMYAACATSSLVIGQAAYFISNQNVDTALAFTSSNVAGAQRQFRNPNTYGEQKKESMTSTVSGAGAIILSNQPSDIVVKRWLIGNIVDWHYDNANDMGCAMAPAVFQLLDEYCRKYDDLNSFDCILSGDLSSLGLSFLKDLLNDSGYENIDQLNDCGLLIYDIQKQNVFSGGSGCACSMCVSIAHVFKKLEKKEYKKVMVIASGALLSQTSVQQKESIPCIAHGIIYERM